MGKQSKGGRGGRGGRGRGGRGGRVGRGGRGGHGRGGGRGGRMMRGGGRGGRGGRMNGRGQYLLPPNRLQMLSNHICRRMLSYLTEDDHRTLGSCFPRFRLPPKNQNQQGNGKGGGPHANGPNANGEQNAQSDPKKEEKPTEEPLESESGQADSTEPEANPASSEVEEKDKEESAEESESGSDPASSEEKKQEPVESENNSESKPKDEEVCTAAQKQKSGPSITDPHTLLARLNSKRLYQRIRFLQKEKRDYRDAYPFHKTTEEIALLEWKTIMAGFNQAARIRIAARESEENGEEKAAEEPSIAMAPIPSSCELLLFSPCPRAVAVLASYPRSGNSLLRNLYERTTLRVTGSDMWGGLTKHDLVGEAATQTNCVQFVKTHFPERMGNPPFPVNRAVLLVRNPYDAMESYFNLMMTNTHTTSLSEEQREKMADVFAEMCKKEILVWRDFHEYWLRQNIPLLVIRYEDLIRYTDKVIAKVLGFVLEIKNMNFFESRIDRCIREEQIERLGSYRPRSGGIGKSLKKYSQKLLHEINMEIVDTMTKLGYREMLVFPGEPEEWRLEPLDQYAVYIPGKDEQPLVINKQGLVRGPKRNTNWMQVRKSMKVEEDDKQCNCYKCIRARM